MVLTERSFRSLIVVLVLVGIGALGASSSLASHAGTRSAPRRRCCGVKCSKGRRTDARHCTREGHRRSNAKPKANEKRCPSCKAGCPTLRRPTSRPGETALIGGLEVAGGPASSPQACAHWGAGEVRVETLSGEVITTRKIAEGDTFDISISPGIYRLTAVVGSSTSRQAGPLTVTAGHAALAIIEFDLP